MKAAFVLLLVLLPCVLSASVAPSRFNGNSNIEKIVRDDYGTGIDLSGLWLGDYDATQNYNFLKISVTQTSEGQVVGTFVDNDQTTFNVTFTQDQQAALGVGYLFQDDIECGTVVASAYVWDDNHFSFAWGPGSPCGDNYPGQTGEFFRDVNNC